MWIVSLLVYFQSQARDKKHARFVSYVTLRRPSLRRLRVVDFEGIRCRREKGGRGKGKGKEKEQTEQKKNVVFV